jgi:hypothetical protein
MKTKIFLEPYAKARGFLRRRVNERMIGKITSMVKDFPALNEVVGRWSQVWMLKR